jgi:DNA-binding transcriptional ArsR family regulator
VPRASVTTSKTRASAPHAAAPAGLDGRPLPIHRVKAELFRVLGHPVRVRILELLRERERSVGELQAALEIDSSGTSQHLGALRRQGLLEGRRDGTSVFYRVKDPRTFQLLEVARQILTGHLEDTQAILGELARAASEPTTRGAKR